MIHDYFIAIVCFLLGFFIGIQKMISMPANDAFDRWYSGRIRK